MITNASWDYSPSTSGLPFKPLIGLLLMLAVLVAAVAVLPQVHAELRHGSDALSIRQCLDQRGPQQVWRSNDRTTFYRLCQLDDGRWGLQAAIWDKVLDRLVEKTAFVKGEGSWSELTQYLAKFATRYTGPLGP